MSGISILNRKMSLALVVSLAGILIAPMSYSETAQPDNICRVSGKGLGFKACPLPVWHKNTYDSYNLTTGKTYTTYLDTQILGARLDPGTGPIPIHAFNKCYYVDNHSGVSIFVPFRTDEEWSSFLRNHPADISFTDCMLEVFYATNRGTSQGDHASLIIQGYSTPAVLSQVLSEAYAYSDPGPCRSGNKIGVTPCSWTEEIEVEFESAPPIWRVQSEQVIVRQDGEELLKPPNVP